MIPPDATRGRRDRIRKRENGGPPGEADPPPPPLGRGPRSPSTHIQDSSPQGRRRGDQPPPRPGQIGEGRGSARNRKPEGEPCTVCSRDSSTHSVCTPSRRTSRSSR